MAIISAALMAVSVSDVANHGRLKGNEMTDWPCKLVLKDGKLSIENYLLLGFNTSETDDPYAIILNKEGDISWRKTTEIKLLTNKASPTWEDTEWGNNDK